MRKSSLLLLLIFVSAAALLCACTPAGVPEDTGTAATEQTAAPPVTTEPPEDNVFLYYGDTVLFEAKTWECECAFTASEGSSVTYLRTGNGPEILRVRLDYADGSFQDIDVPEGPDYAALRLNRSGDCLVSFVMTEPDGDTFFVSSAGAFEAAANDPSMEGRRVEQLRDIYTDKDVTVTVPFRWVTAGFYFTCGSLRFDSSSEGSMVIENSGNSDISCSGLLCTTPLWNYSVSALFSDFSERMFCRVDAASVNGRTVDRSSVLICSADDLGRFFGGVFSEYASGIRSVEFSGEFEIPDISLRDTEEIVFFGGVTIGGTVSLESSSERLRIDTSLNSGEVYYGLSLNAPACDLEWTGPGSPEFSVAERLYDLRAYNGTLLDEMLGGSGAGRIVSASADGIPGTAEGKYIVFRKPYSSLSSMQSAAVTAVLPEGCSGAASASPDGRLYYTVTDPQGGTFAYRMIMEYEKLAVPVIYLTTDSGSPVTSKTSWVGGTFSIEYNGYAGMTDGDDISGAQVNLRGRGHSSWALAKKPYSIKFSSKTSLFGLERSKDWVLQANHADYSLIRNNLAMSIGSELTNMLFVPHSYPVDVFLNGVYAGLYTLTEKIEIGDGRIEAEKDSAEVDTDYLLEIGGEMEKTSWGGSNVFTTSYCIYVEIKDPDTDVLTKEQFDYIFSYVKKADAAVKSLKGYDAYIDVDSAIDWFILTELSYNTDGAMRRSDFLLKTKGPDGKIYFASPWDFDYAFGNIYFDAPYEEWICLGDTASLAAYEARKGYKYIRDNWFTFLLTDPAFKTRLKERWNEVKDDVYSAAVSCVEARRADCAGSAAQNFLVWTGVLGKRIQYQSKSVYKIKTWEGQLDYLRSFIDHRYAWMDAEINSY